MKKALDSTTTGILVNGIPINNIRYADDTVLLAETMEGLQQLLDQIVRTSEEFGLTLNIQKTKYMVITKSRIPVEQLLIEDETVEKV